METTHFDQKTVDRMRRAAARAAKLPPDLPEGWCRSPVDPGRIVAAFPSLKLKKGFVLRGYVFRSSGNGNGVVWAMPTASSFPGANACPSMEGTFLEAPRPPEAIDPMEALDGDGTPLAYLSASLLVRELWEFGAEWHGCEWSTHTILCADPWTRPPPKQPAREFTHLTDWIWADDKPTEWQPTVITERDSRQVVFHSFTGLKQERIERHVDRYTAGSYSPKVKSKEIATGQIGYIH